MKKRGEFYVCDRGTCFSKTPSLPCRHDAGNNDLVIELIDDPRDDRPSLLSTDPADIRKNMASYNRCREEAEREHEKERALDELRAQLFFATRKTNTEFTSPFAFAARR